MPSEGNESASVLSSIRVDQLSWTLSAIIVLLLIAHGLLGPKAPLMHPILLGRQSEMSRVRKKSESSVVTNSSSMFGMLPTSPERSINSLIDLVDASNGKLERTGRASKLLASSFGEDVRMIRNKLWEILGPSDVEKTHPRLLVLTSQLDLNLLLTLAAATLPLITIIGPPAHSSTIPIGIRQIYEKFIAHLSLVICDRESHDGAREIFGAHKHQIKILLVDEVVGVKTSAEPAKESNPHHQAELGLAQVLMIRSSKEEPCAIYSFSPDNLLAGITGSLGLFPLTAKLSSSDRLAIEVDPDSPWGHGNSLAAAAAYAGATFCFWTDPKAVRSWEPTILVMKPTSVEAIAQHIVHRTNASILSKLALARRLALLAEGTLTEPTKVTEDWFGPRVRAIITDGPISQSHASLIRAEKGCSVQRLYSHHLAAGPILATQAYDFQMLQNTSSAIHCGPPCVNIECKMIDVPELAIQNNDAVKGKLAIRGPSLGKQAFDDPSHDQSAPNRSRIEDFVVAHENAELLSNGTIRLHSSPPDWDH